MDRIVELRHRVQATNSANGEKAATWPTAYSKEWAKRTDMLGTKRLIAQQLTTQRTVEFTIRYRTDVLATDQLIESETGLVFEIMQASEIPRRVGLSLLCRAVMK